MRAEHLFPIAAAVLLPFAGAAMGQTVVNPANCHTYMLTPTASTWSAAEAYAQSLGGHLATIRSAAEQSWINSTFLVGPDATQAFWIGLHRSPGFVWTSGEAPAYMNWHSGEPNNACGGEPATAINWYISEGQGGNPGDWNDTNDGGVHYNNCGSAGSVPYRGIVEFFTACPCSADFNNDGAVGTDADIDDFFACISGNCCARCGSADFNGDGAVGTDADIEAFFRVLGGGPC
jgi:hypothetical protein